MDGILMGIFILSIVFFWLLIFRIIAAGINLDPYNPPVQFLYRITEPLLKPFRRGIFLRPLRIDPAILPPLLLLAFIILALGLRR